MKRSIRVVAIFIVVLVITILVVVTSRGGKQSQPGSALPAPTPTPTPSTYHGVSVETGSNKDVIRVLGAPIRTSYYNGVATLIYPSTMRGRNTSVEIYQDGTIKRIIEPLSESQGFSAVAAGLGKEDIILYGKHEELGFRLYVYADKGVALLANPNTNVVREKWYFPKTDSLGFQAALGESLSTTHTEIKQ